MSSLKSTTLFVFILTINIYSQWQWVHPRPQGNSLNSVKSIDENNVIACGDYGTILKTTDGGNDWILIDTDLDNSLKSISIIDLNNIWICGDNGIILKSSNGGNHWSLQNSNTELNLNTIFFLDNNNGYCAGGYWDYSTTASILLHTTDGGNNWEEINLNTDYPINKIFFVDSIGFMCGGIPGSNGYVNTAIYLKSTNGGITWDVRSFDNSEFTSLYFINENLGVLTAEWSFYYKTTNGGIDWVLKQIPEANHLEDIYFQDESNGWIIGGGNGGGAQIFHTTNGGENWQVQKEWGSGWYSCLLDYEFINSNEAYAVGYDGEIRKTTDEGQTWQLKTERYFSDSNSAFFLNSDLGWASKPGIIYKTTNGGINWTNVPNPGISTLIFKDENFGYGISINSIGITTDGGQNWTQYSINSPGLDIYLKSLYHWDEDNGIAWGEYFMSSNGQMGNILFKTSQSWSSYSTTFLPGNHIYSATAYSNYAWGVGPQGFIIRSSDYGNTWQTINTTYSQNFYKIFALNNNNVWILSNEQILESDDTGLTWYPIMTSVSGDTTFIDIIFKNENEGWLLVQTYNFINHYYPKNNVSYTTDGGNLWTKLDFTSQGYLNNIQITIDDKLFAFGDNGKILKSDVLINSVDEFDEKVINSYKLSQNYPNPFNPSTKIKFEIPGQTRNDNALVTLKVYDLLGREITTLVNEEKPAGEYEVEFNANSHSGEVRNLPSGIYFYQLKAGDFVETKKMILLK